MTKENNNGWIKIEREIDLMEKCILYVYPEFKGHFIFFYDNDEFSKKELIKNHTHYQLTEKPQPPIY